ncbi:centrosomal protein of 89 kDa-like [Entelurus aequoreus]|uniref:centrosomal protein of 89 kDa-like n=1 Tax=Entelurus aequoreus TaxID=161455 RepID=UPI002B1E66B4|nr:centrosomal protein of 89 kDa-like [Entelurus aequoreus]
MLRLNFRREKDKEYKHIAHGLIPAASIAPKAAVPRTPPPRSPNPSPERPRSALAAAILSSSLTGQTWALPPTRPRSFSEAQRSASFVSEPNISTALFTRDRWSEDFVARPRLSWPDHSEEDDQEEDVRAAPMEHSAESPQASPMLSSRESSSPESPQQRGLDLPKASSVSLKKKASVKRSSRSRGEDVPLFSQQGGAKTEPKEAAILPSSDSLRGRGAVRALKEENAKLEAELRRLQQEVTRSPASTSTTGMQTQLHTLTQQTQELLDQKHALKPQTQELLDQKHALKPQTQELLDQKHALKHTNHALNAERTHSKQEADSERFSPRASAYEDRLKEKAALLHTAEDEVKRLRARLEEAAKENKRLDGELAKTGGMSPDDRLQVQQQALLVLQENHFLSQQLEALHVKTKDHHSKHLAEVSKVSKQLMLTEAENQRLQEELDGSRREEQSQRKEVLRLRGLLKDAVAWEEHHNIAGRLRRQLEQEQGRNMEEVEEVRLQASGLQVHNCSLLADNAKLTADVQRMEAELELSRQANRKAEKKLSVLKHQKDECALKEEKTRKYLESVLAVADGISQERDQLLHMASTLQQEKQEFLGKMVSGTIQFGKLEERVKVYRKQASSRLAALEEAAEGKAASYHREVVHLQSLLAERQQAEERLLQSKRAVEEELEVVWQAATRENQHIKDTLWDSRPIGDLLEWGLADTTSPGRPLGAAHKSSDHLDVYT